MNICEESIYKKVFDEWQNPIQRFLLSKGLHLDDVADLTQECFLKLWKNCSKVKFETVSSYLFKMASNISIDHFRKSQTQLKYIKHNKSDSEIKDGQYLMEMNEFKSHLENAIDTMKPASKEVFIMHRFNNMPYKAIASHLDISQKAVEKRMHKALLHLSQQKIKLKR